MKTIYAVAIPEELDFEAVKKICLYYGGMYSSRLRGSKGTTIPPHYTFLQQTNAQNAEEQLKEMVELNTLQGMG